MKTPVLIPETWLDRAEYYAVKNASVLGYGMKTTWQFGYALNFDLSDAARINDVLRTYFERERGSLPPGTLVLRTLNNHDTVCDLGRVQQRFGAGLARALYGVCVAVPGVPMMYQEEETGSFDVLRRLNWARRSLPELGAGDADYLSVQAPPEVFSVLRSLDANQALCLVNLSGKTIEAVYTMPGCAADTVCDAVSGLSAKMDAGQFLWTLAPYASAFLRISETPEIVMPEPRWTGEIGTVSPTPSPFAVEVTPNGFTVWQGRLVGEFTVEGDWAQTDGSDGSVRFRSAFGAVDLRVEVGAVSVACDLNTGAPAPVLRVRNAAQWQVSGRTAMLSDRTLRRHFPFAEGSDYVWRRGDGWGAAPWGNPYNGVAPTGRLWQTLFEPLHPEQPALAFDDADGAGLVVKDVATDAMNVVLTDCTDEVNPDPYRLELRFLAVDTDLSPRVRAAGLGQFWEFESPAPEVKRPLKVSFRIAPVGVQTDTPRLPVAQCRVVETRDGDTYTEGSHAVFTIKPGRIAWSELTPVDGIYRVGLELRHSEAGGDKTEMADKYVVEIDGVAQQLEWTTLNTHTYGNAYFGIAYTPPLDLRGKSHSIAVTTKANWCAVRKRFLLRTP
jgi:hypothetical protein